MASLWRTISGLNFVLMISPSSAFCLQLGVTFRHCNRISPKPMSRISFVSIFPAFSDYVTRMRAAPRRIFVADRRDLSPKLEVKSDSRGTGTKEDLRGRLVIVTPVMVKKGAPRNYCLPIANQCLVEPTRAFPGREFREIFSLLTILTPKIEGCIYYLLRRSGFAKH